MFIRRRDLQQRLEVAMQIGYYMGYAAAKAKKAADTHKLTLGEEFLHTQRKRSGLQ